ncbi:UFD1-domain-containing protein [Saitoella complicata NRRL Y-17804]|uniref:UFD1-domain-containing protein n=1 Tax=Saitoella complicata (strain BCRC 22490 / CBS 7301 / JCM 7358 / NBRC 10748 / NRRL Y-17804) TaxID=698492 RepID=UPI000867694D|nr:UFD1-domain-containing protein [Saitoella complicata NRRL Y-17804]ODQ53715.1 UFD1-domain-containing protein [Saitoella complicata NRRL Y-17804]
MSPIQWSKELIVQDHPASGDKIVLPPSALEEMLGGSSETNRELPSPLTFALLNPRTRKLTHSGLREFSAEEGVVLLPKHVRESLDLKEGELVAVAVRELSKGTLVKLRPLDAGYDEQDWKALLEARLNSHYTTLTKGEVLPIVAGNQTMQFLIDEIQPADAVLIVDTDLEVVLEPLDEQQAEETAKKRKLAVKENVVIEVGSAVQGQVERGQYANYELSEWSRDNGLVLEVKISNGDADLLVSTTPKPVDDLHMWSSFDSAKRVALSASNIELSTATKLNNKCATATGKALTMAEAAAIVKPIKEALMDISTPLEFCVDEGTTKRRILAEMVLDEDASYDIEWRIKAIDVEASNVANAQLWLERNAVKKAEA